jgi:hypothetical protein
MRELAKEHFNLEIRPLLDQTSVITDILEVHNEQDSSRSKLYVAARFMTPGFRISRMNDDPSLPPSFKLDGQAETDQDPRRSAFRPPAIEKTMRE